MYHTIKDFKILTIGGYTNRLTAVTRFVLVSHVQLELSDVYHILQILY